MGSVESRRRDVAEKSEIRSTKPETNPKQSNSHLDRFRDHAIGLTCHIGIPAGEVRRRPFLQAAPPPRKPRMQLASAARRDAQPTAAALHAHFDVPKTGAMQH